MNEYPILMSSPMVRAIHEGRKTQTRRVCKWPKGFDPSRAEVERYERYPDGSYRAIVWGDPGDDAAFSLRCPYGGPGDRLWVRETWAVCKYYDGRPTNGCGSVPEVAVECRVLPDAVTIIPGRAHRTIGTERGKWRSARYMPRWARRITLEVTDVRVQRVWEISEEDAVAEGVEIKPIHNMTSRFCQTHGIQGVGPNRSAFENLWDSINAKRGYGWVVNPWVWAVTFMRVES